MRLEDLVERSAVAGHGSIVAAGPNACVLHYRADSAPLKSNELVLIDAACELDGYASDITRTFVVGKASDRHREVYEQVLKAEKAAIDAARPGITGKELDAVARDLLGTAGLAEYFGHGLGHGLGRLVHDGGALNPSSQTVLAPGQVWTIEPGAYIEGFGGVRIEDDVVITSSGCEVLTFFPKELLELPG